MSRDVRDAHSVHILQLCNSFMKILVQVFNSTAQLILELLIIIPILKKSNFVNKK